MHAASTFDFRQPENRGHGAGALGPALEHELAAATHQPKRIGEGEGARGVIRGEFAERMAGGGANVRAKAVGDRGPHGGAMRE